MTSFSNAVFPPVQGGNPPQNWIHIVDGYGPLCWCQRDPLVGADKVDETVGKLKLAVAVSPEEALR
jgi:hypothetical protein